MDGSISERLLISVFLPSAKKGRRKSREVNQGSIRKLLSASPKSIDLFLKIISKGGFIILKHLDLWDLKSKPLPRANAPPNNIEPHLDYSDSQLPPSWHYL